MMRDITESLINCPPIWVIRVIAASILSFFSIYTAFWGVFPDMIQRSFHIGIILFLVYLSPIEKMSMNELMKSLKAYFFIILSPDKNFFFKA